MRTARLLTHPSDPAVALLDAGPALGALMGRFEAARRTDQAGRPMWLIPADQLGQLGRFLKIHDTHLVDERQAPSAGPNQPLPECATCGQPAHRTKPPAYCPACGDAWQPLFVTDSTYDWRRQASCPACRVSQPDGFPRCGACGAHMPPPRPLARPSADRPNLPDPVPFSETIDEWVATVPAARQARDQHEPAPDAMT